MKQRHTDLTGKRFGRLVVKTRAPNNADGKARWNCVCDCGRRTIVRGDTLLKGLSSSCHCLSTERSGLKATELAKAREEARKRDEKKRTEIYDRFARIVGDPCVIKLGDRYIIGRWIPTMRISDILTEATYVLKSTTNAVEVLGEGSSWEEALTKALVVSETDSRVKARNDEVLRRDRVALAPIPLVGAPSGSEE